MHVLSMPSHQWTEEAFHLMYLIASMERDWIDVLSHYINAAYICSQCYPINGMEEDYEIICRYIISMTSGTISLESLHVLSMASML